MSAKFAAQTWPVDEFPIVDVAGLQELNRKTPDGICYEPEYSTLRPSQIVQWVDPGDLDIDAEHRP